VWRRGGLGRGLEFMGRPGVVEGEGEGGGWLSLRVWPGLPGALRLGNGGVDVCVCVCVCVLCVCV
jgi:hypothetical protein